jgi:hypothetical protein
VLIFDIVSQLGEGMINVLVLEILPYDFLLHNEAENTKSTLKIEYMKSEPERLS